MSTHLLGRDPYYDGYSVVVNRGIHRNLNSFQEQLNKKNALRSYSMLVNKHGTRTVFCFLLIFIVLGHGNVPVDGFY